MSQTKECRYCSKVKEYHHFSKNIRTADGRRDECNECRNEKRRVIRAVDYDALFVAQNGKCAICGIDAEIYGKRFSIDHDHADAANPIRALLCQQCNTLIGMADESVEVLTQAIGYLKHHHIKII
jgi:uncharacterized protein YlaI